MTHFNLAELRANLTPISKPIGARLPVEEAYLMARGWADTGLPASPWPHPTNRLSYYGHHTAVNMQIDLDERAAISQPAT